MIFLLATVLLNVLLSVIFRLYERFRINTLLAIVVNYWVCVLTGSIFIGHFPIGAQSLQQPWLPWAAGMGLGFFALFNLIGWRTREDGITTTTIANKLSLVIPVAFAFFLYGDQIMAGKIAGILLAFPAVYLTTRSRRDEQAQQAPNIFWPAMLFIGSGLLDTAVTYVTSSFFSGSASLQGQAIYTVHTFAAAASIGTVVVVLQLLRGRMRLAWRHLLAGLVLGVPNFFSIYLLIRLLHSGFMQASAAIPVNNIAIVLLSAAVGMLAFKEPRSRTRYLGLALSVASILLILLSDLYATGSI